MAGQVFCTIYNQGNAFQHSVVFDKGDPASWIHEFEHQVLYLGNKPFFDKAPIRVHKPVRLYIPIDKITPSLIQKVIQGEAVEKVMLRWFRYQEKTKSDSEYFRHIFETVSFDQCRFVMPDVKNPLFDRYDHALELSFRYKKVTWIYMQGNLMVSDEWHGSEFEDGEEAETEEEETTEEEVAPAEPVEEVTKKVTLSEAKFLPEEGKTDFNQKCNVTVKVAYLQETTKKKVLFKLFSSFNKNTQDMQHEIEAFESGGKADAALTLYYNDEYYSDTAKPADASVEYFVKVTHPEADEVESERLKLPFKKQQTVQFIEIPDVVFNHNSAVPMIDADGKLINAVVATLSFAGKNPEKEATIYGHTDSSGETDYNLKLSELRCKSVKAFIDNKPQDFVSICKEKSKVEDYQTFLLVLTKKYSWECDPGAVDNKDGPKTKEALKQFQIDYNLFYDQSIAEDGIMGPATWEAFFKVIMELILGYAKAEAGESVPQLKYGKNNGIYPCGEKYAQDAYAKKGRKSQKDRRVEIVFNDPSQPIEDTPYVDTIVMEPIDIVAKKPEQPATKIKSITAQCQHTDEGKRIAHWGETLQIVPDAIGDKITFKIESESPESSINWAGPGIAKSSTGYTITRRYSSLSIDLKNWFANLLSGIPPFIPETTDKIFAIDSSSKDKKQVMVQVFPYEKKEYKLDVNKYLEPIKKLTDKFQTACDFLGQKIEFTYLDGNITVYGQYKEDKTSKDVFFLFGAEGGFNPLFGAKTEIKFPLDGLPWVPAALKKYIAEINAVFELEGKISLTVYIERNEPRKFETGGKASGEIETKLGLSATVWKGKLLDVKFLAVSGIGAEAKLFGDKGVNGNPDKWKFHLELSAEWKGLKGQISWKIFDGTIEDDLTITVKGPVPLGKIPINL
ncbi:MAG TPA: type VI secretion system tube protein Hcp [Chitinispirillaceae bacterium]|nr:type VI secretion system tube protein Hcp [Chitinispirillaceae bacterium]